LLGQEFVDGELGEPERVLPARFLTELRVKQWPEDVRIVGVRISRDVDVELVVDEDVPVEFVLSHQHDVGIDAHGREIGSERPGDFGGCAVLVSRDRLDCQRDLGPRLTVEEISGSLDAAAGQRSRSRRHPFQDGSSRRPLGRLVGCWSHLDTLDIGRLNI
jgi:hypothetical protein